MIEGNQGQSVSHTVIDYQLLRGIDLNLLIVFDAVMKELNITRAAQLLGISQPAVSHAVARMKVMFDEDLFVRTGRGIQPTLRAMQLSSTLRRALLLIQSGLHEGCAESFEKERVFTIGISSPLDNLLISRIVNQSTEMAPTANFSFQSVLSPYTRQQLRYKEVEFVISYDVIDEPGFVNIPLFNDKMVLVTRRGHPRIHSAVSVPEIYHEKHAIVSLERYASFSRPWYETEEKRACIAFQGNAMISVLSVVSQTNMIAIAPYWLVSEFSDNNGLQIFPLPFRTMHRTCYLSWYESTIVDENHQMMSRLLIDICRG